MINSETVRQFTLMLRDRDHGKFERFGIDDHVKKGELTYEVALDVLCTEMFKADRYANHTLSKNLMHLGYLANAGGHQINWTIVSDALVRRSKWGPITNTEYVSNIESKRIVFGSLMKAFPDFDINLPTGDGITYLMVSVGARNVDSRLLGYYIDELGADVNALSNEHGRPIHFLNRTDIKMKAKFDFLIQHGANPAEKISFKAFAELEDFSDYVINPQQDAYDSLKAYIALNLDGSGNDGAKARKTFEMIEIIERFEHAQNSVSAASDLTVQQRRTRARAI